MCECTRGSFDSEAPPRRWSWHDARVMTWMRALPPSAWRRAIAVLILWVSIIGLAGAAAAQDGTLSTEAAVGLAIPELVSGVYAQEGADVNLSTLSTVVRGADAADLAVYAAVFAEPMAEPDAVARSLLTVVQRAQASSTPVLVVVYAPDQFGHADRGIGRTEMDDALARRAGVDPVGLPDPGHRGAGRLAERQRGATLGPDPPGAWAWPR